MSTTNFGRESGDTRRRHAHRVLDRVRAGRPVRRDAIEWALSHLGDLGREVTAPPTQAREARREARA